MPECEICGYESETEHGVATHKAVHDGDGSKKRTYQCEQCGDTFEDYPSRREGRGRENFFCSRNCKDEYARKEKLYFECEVCGDEVVRHPSTAQAMGDYDIQNHFCSKQCESVYKTEEWVGEKHPRWKDNTVEKSCDECGVAIEVNKYYLDKQNNFFCSHSCHTEYQLVYDRYGECEWCGDEFELQPRQRRGLNTLLCSDECSRSWMSKNRSGEENPMWRGGKEKYYGANWLQSRRKVLERDDKECQFCGKTREEHYESYGQDLDVHHIKPIREFDGDYETANKQSNLITLCRSCHTEAEHHDLDAAELLSD